MRWTVRLRLTLLYSGLFLVAGVLLVGLIYFLVEYSPFPRPPAAPAPGGGVEVAVPAPEVEVRQVADMRRLLFNSLIALVVMAFASMLLGWVVAGRVLRPLGDMTATVRRITAERLDQRLAASGPDDELKELADTFDELLDRLEAAFTAQRRFVANASHELRTPLTLQQAMTEVALGDPEADAESLRAVLRRLLAAGKDQERLIEALLILARSQQGLRRRQPIDLAVITSQALDQRELRYDERPGDKRYEGVGREGVGGEGERRGREGERHAGQDEGCEGERHAGQDEGRGDEGRQDQQGQEAGEGARVRGEFVLESAVASGDPDLVERLLGNLLDNALRHNVPTGWIKVTTAVRSGRPVLTVSNSGPVIPPEGVHVLLQPFQRLETGRKATGDGLGLGLSIVAAIVQAHHGSLETRPLPEGGLEVTVTLVPG